jgi:hypothetical protein
MRLRECMRRSARNSIMPARPALLSQGASSALPRLAIANARHPHPSTAGRGRTM